MKIEYPQASLQQINEAIEEASSSLANGDFGSYDDGDSVIVETGGKFVRILEMIEQQSSATPVDTFRSTLKVEDKDRFVGTKAGLKLRTKFEVEKIAAYEAWVSLGANSPRRIIFTPLT